MKIIILISIILLPVLVTTACFTKPTAETNISPSSPVQTASFSYIGPDYTEPANTISIPTQLSPTIEMVFETVEFTEAEKAKLAELIANLPVNVKEQFERKYEAWEAIWDDPEYSVYSDASIFTRSDEYQELLLFCREQGQMIWPLTIKQFLQDDWFISKNLLFDLTLEKYRYIMDDIREESNLERQEGKYPSAEDNARKYAKALLALY